VSKKKSRGYRLFGATSYLVTSTTRLGQARDEIMRDRPKEGDSIFPRVFAGFPRDRMEQTVGPKA
jgi:hypothetical protein